MENYDKDNVEQWIKHVEKAIENRYELDREKTVEEKQIYNEIERHYSHAQDLITSEGMSDNAAYELETAYKLLEQLGWELQVQNEPRGDTDWDEYYRDQL